MYRSSEDIWKTLGYSTDDWVFNCLFRDSSENKPLQGMALTPFSLKECPSSDHHLNPFKPVVLKIFISIQKTSSFHHQITGEDLSCAALHCWCSSGVCIVPDKIKTKGDQREYAKNVLCWEARRLQRLCAHSPSKETLCRGGQVHIKWTASCCQQKFFRCTSPVLFCPRTRQLSADSI